jgi:hypothetical protein
VADLLLFAPRRGPKGDHDEPPVDLELCAARAAVAESDPLWKPAREEQPSAAEPLREARAGLLAAARLAGETRYSEAAARAAPAAGIILEQRPIDARAGLGALLDVVTYHALAGETDEATGLMDVLWALCPRRGNPEERARLRYVEAALRRACESPGSMDARAPRRRR